MVGTRLHVAAISFGLANCGPNAHGPTRLGSSMLTQSFMRRLHLVAGVSTAVAFLASGAYMRFAVDPESLPPGTDLLYISRHIYMLGPALMHLVLSAYVRPLPGRVAARLQWTGTTLLVVSSILLVSAFVVEPIGGRGRTAVSAFGMFTFLGGSLLHVIAPRLGRRGDA